MMFEGESAQSAAPAAVGRDAIVARFLRMAYRIAEAYARRNMELALEDIRQDAAVALVRAADRYLASGAQNEATLPSYVFACVRGGVLNAIREASGKPNGWYIIWSRGEQFRAAHLLDTEREPTDAQVAVNLGITVARWRQIRDAIVQRLASLDAPLSADYPTLDLHGRIADRQSERGLRLVEDRDFVERTVRRLPPRQRGLVAHRLAGESLWAIAVESGRQMAAVRTDFHRARVRLIAEHRRTIE